MSSAGATGGWIKIHRELTNKAIWQTSTPEQKVILLTLLLMANHEEKEWEWQGKKYICKPGQMITSLASIKEKSGKGVTIQKVRTALERFEKYEFLTSQSTNRNRLITIVNWEEYQENPNATNRQANKQVTSKQQAGNKLITTNKNDKNDKNDKKCIYADLKNVSLTDEEYKKLQERFPKDLGERIERLSLYIASTGKKYKSHYATILAWSRRDQEQKAAKKPNSNDFEQREYSDEFFKELSNYDLENL